MNATTRRHGSFIAVAVFAPPFAFAQIPAANSAGDYKKHMDDIQEAKDDLAYAEMMNRCRVGSPTDDDIRALMPRFISIITGSW